jgi:hypothetical protein
MDSDIPFMGGEGIMKRGVVWSLLILVAISVSGCATYKYADGGRNRGTDVDSLRVMSKADVIALSTAGIGNDVIIGQIEATGSTFELTTRDILDLAGAGVSDTVISTMVRNDRTSGRAIGLTSSPYYWYMGYPFWYPWYSPFYSRLSFGFYGSYGRRHYFAPRPMGHWYGGLHSGHFSGGGHGPVRGGRRHR